MINTSPEHCTQWSEIEKIMSDIFDVDDMSGFDLFRRFKLIDGLAHYLLGEYRKEDVQISQARMRLLIWLTAHKRMGQASGLTPSKLSQHLGVSRNTVSALLNGLEEQGLIERQLSPTDRRQFQIHITPDGIDLVETRAPQFAAFVAGLFKDLSPAERKTLMQLLGKLIDSMLKQAATMELRVPETDFLTSPPTETP